MCGIFGYIGLKKNSAEIVLEGLKSLEYRGYDSWGIAVLEQLEDGNKLDVKKDTGKITDQTACSFPQGSTAFGHTRWATHGGVTAANAHPHLSESGNLAIIHNGIIENYSELKDDLKGKKYYHYKSETDTEVALHLIEYIYDKNQKSESGIDSRKIFLKSVAQAFKMFTGMNAIIVLDAKTNTFVAAKNGSPLVIGKGIHENYLASDAHALLPYTRDIYYMDDNELVRIDGDTVEVFDLGNLSPKESLFSHLDWNIDSTRKGKFPHFMLKEIYDQREVVRAIAGKSEDEIVKFSELIRSSFGTYFVGCGTAAYACLAGTYIFSKIAKRHINYSVGSEFGYLVDFLTPKSLVVALSQSGETIDVIEAVKKAKVRKAEIASIVNVIGSSLYRMSHYRLLLDAGVEKAVVSTKAFTAKLAHIILLAYSYDGRLEEGRRLILKAYLAINRILEDTWVDEIKKLADQLAHKQHIYIIGRGLSYPITLETALKIKESSYIHAEGFAGGELKHGAIALIEKGTPCIAFVPSDETESACLAGAMEMKARGGMIIGISPKKYPVFDYHIPYTDCSVASVIPQALIGQLIGYFLAVKQGLDPDKPRNLAKSVTVK